MAASIEIPARLGGCFQKVAIIFFSIVTIITFNSGRDNRQPTPKTIHVTTRTGALIHQVVPADVARPHPVCRRILLK